MRKVELTEEELDQVFGGKLAVSCWPDDEYGTVTRKDKEGKVIAVYHFAPENAASIYSIFGASGISEADKISQMSQYFI